MPRRPFHLHVLIILALGADCLGLSPMLGDYWDGNAAFQLEATGVGANCGFHFPSMLWEGTEIWGYYIKGYSYSGGTRLVVGRARSTSGLSWADDGIVLDVGGTPEWTYEAETLSHQVGRADADGWSASPSLDAAGYLCFGPYTTSVAAGASTAIFSLMIDNNTSPSETVVTLDVYDADAGAVLGTKAVNRTAFTAAYTYQAFTVGFTGAAGHRLEFRTYWHDKAYIREDSVGVAQGSSPSWDGTMASFPGIWKDAGTYYLVYEGSGTSSGDIGLATSSDGVNFLRSNPNPILRHNTSGWERANIGTPSLYKEGSTWYLFYHGFDGTDCKVGVATGTSLTSLTRYSGNPIISTGSGTWDSGTIGRRSRLFKEASYYYLAFEGSTEQPYSTAQWSSGLARSTDLLHWTKCPTNPIIPRTAGNFGNDGPELLNIDGQYYLYVRNAPSDRYKLVYTNPPNTAPVVTAGADLTVVLPSVAALAGAATDDGLPSPPATLSMTWSQRSGPGTATFADAHAAATTALFSLAGTYVLRLTASDSQMSSYDELTVMVREHWTLVDFDQDGDVDQSDFGLMQTCLSGAGEPVQSGCAFADVDQDGDADAADVVAFGECLGGAGRLAGC